MPQTCGPPPPYPTGEPLARVDLDAIRSRVEALAVVRSADVTRQWPDEVLIEIEERVAIAVVDIGGEVRGMDKDGVVFREYRHAPAALPRVQTSADTRSDALREAAAVIAALPPDLGGRVDHVEVETVDRITLVLRDGRTVMWGSADESPEKATVLARLLQQKAAEVRRVRARAGRRRPTDAADSAEIRAARGVSPRFTDHGCLMSSATRG